MVLRNDTGQFVAALAMKLDRISSPLLAENRGSTCCNLAGARVKQGTGGT